MYFTKDQGIFLTYFAHITFSWQLVYTEAFKGVIWHKIIALSKMSGAVTFLK